jgi:hypothetical protein
MGSCERKRKPLQPAPSLCLCPPIDEPATEPAGRLGGGVGVGGGGGVGGVAAAAALALAAAHSQWEREKAGGREQGRGRPGNESTRRRRHSALHLP